MEDFGRATRGGVGAVIIGLALAASAVAAGWFSGSLYSRQLDATGCRGCTSSVAAAEARPTEAAASLVARPTATPEATPPAGLPFVSARSIAVVETSCGRLIYGRDEHARLPPASLTKLMTAAVALDQADASTMITTNVDGAQLYTDTGSTIMGLKPGMQLSLLDLLYGLLLPSGNDAAIAIAEGIGGTQAKFVDMMNAKAQSLALEDTHFTNPHGLNDPNLYSSAYDIAMLSRYVMQNPTLRQIVGTEQYQPNWDGPAVWNGNRFLSEYAGADGVKIGYTEQSAQTIVASATRDGRSIIASLMKSQDRYADSERLLDWAFAQPSPCP
ncbi:MAG: D-alanyl-D-alanine carboxypeptidase [Dehalococcoidia bacterium]|nr:D-alanyl-D-alanine carboxypeptidase [Dehalococcoidia bacterium]